MARPYKILLFIVVGFVILGIIGILLEKGDTNRSSRPLSNPPAYVKQFTVYKEGDGLVIYFVLADQAGQMTRSDGVVTLEIRHVPTDYDEIERIQNAYARKHFNTIARYLTGAGKREAIKEAEKVLLKQELNIKRDNYIRTKIGQGTFQRDALICPLGKIPYRSLGTDIKGQKGKAKLFFLGEGCFLEAEEEFSF